MINDEQIDAIIGAAFMTKMIRAGAGKHIYCLALGRIPVAIKWSIYAQIVNNIGIGLAKISVCLCVLRVIERVGKWLSRFLWVLIAFITASHFVQVRLAPALAAASGLTVLRSCCSWSSADPWPRYGTPAYTADAFLRTLPTW